MGPLHLGQEGFDTFFAALDAYALVKHGEREVATSRFEVEAADAELQRIIQLRLAAIEAMDMPEPESMPLFDHGDHEEEPRFDCPLCEQTIDWSLNGYPGADAPVGAGEMVEAFRG